MATDNKQTEEVIMHKDFFHKSKDAIDQGYYFEALMYEYAAIEGRLEVICGLLGCPCNKELDPKIRKDIKISIRIQCLARVYKIHPACKGSTTKITGDFWGHLKTWTTDRNTYVHGLYKNPGLYSKRLNDRAKLADQGLGFARLLYNEVKRIRRLLKNHPEKIMFDGRRCKGKQCYIV